jgi:hypothetical protein
VSSWKSSLVKKMKRMYHYNHLPFPGLKKFFFFFFKYIYIWLNTHHRQVTKQQHKISAWSILLLFGRIDFLVDWSLCCTFQSLFLIILHVCHSSALLSNWKLELASFEKTRYKLKWLKSLRSIWQSWKHIMWILVRILINCFFHTTA